MSDEIDTWTDKLLRLDPDMDRAGAQKFVHDLYEAAQRDRDEVEAQAAYERDE